MSKDKQPRNDEQQIKEIFETAKHNQRLRDAKNAEGKLPATTHIKGILLVVIAFIIGSVIYLSCWFYAEFFVPNNNWFTMGTVYFSMPIILLAWLEYYVLRAITRLGR